MGLKGGVRGYVFGCSADAICKRWDLGATSIQDGGPAQIDTRRLFSDSCCLGYT